MSFYPEWLGTDAERLAKLRLLMTCLGVQGKQVAQMVNVVEYLGNYCNEKGSNVRLSKLADQKSMTVRTLKRRLQFLRQHGVVRTRRCWGGSYNQVDWEAVRCLLQSGQQRGQHTGHLAPTVAPVSGHLAPVSGHLAPTLYKGITIPLLNTSPPPTSAVSCGWKEAEEALDSIGLAEAARACASARQRGLPPAEVLALLPVWHANQVRWERPLGALYFRIRYAQPGQDPRDLRLWPKASDSFLERQKADERDDRRARAIAAQLAERERAAEELANIQPGPGLLAEFQEVTRGKRR